MRRRIALYGGAFDPPHVCHVVAATYVLCRADVEELRLVPVFRHAFGKEMAPFEDRCAMLAAATAHLGPRVRVDRVEERLGGTSYTIDTVRAVLAAEPDAQPVLVVGADAFGRREAWKSWAELERLVELFVLGRAEVPPPPGVEIRAWLPDISSQDVRGRVAAGRSLGGLVPEAVAQMIDERGLYRGGAPGSAPDKGAAGGAARGSRP